MEWRVYSIPTFKFRYFRNSFLRYSYRERNFYFSRNIENLYGLKNWIKYAFERYDSKRIFVYEFFKTFSVTNTFIDLRFSLDDCIYILTTGRVPTRDSIRKRISEMIELLFNIKTPVRSRYTFVLYFVIFVRKIRTWIFRRIEITKKRPPNDRSRNIRVLIRNVMRACQNDRLEKRTNSNAAPLSSTCFSILHIETFVRLGVYDFDGITD